MEEILGIDALQALINFCISASVAIIIYLAQFPERSVSKLSFIKKHSLMHRYNSLGIPTLKMRSYNRRNHT